jgi:hypothetical protein
MHIILIDFEFTFYFAIFTAAVMNISKEALDALGHPFTLSNAITYSPNEHNLKGHPLNEEVIIAVRSDCLKGGPMMPNEDEKDDNKATLDQVQSIIQTNQAHSSFKDHKLKNDNVPPIIHISQNSFESSQLPTTESTSASSGSSIKSDKASDADWYLTRSPEGILTIDPHTAPKDVVLQELSRHASTLNHARQQRTSASSGSSITSDKASDADWYLTRSPEGILTIDPHTAPKDVVLQELSRHASTLNHARQQRTSASSGSSITSDKASDADWYLTRSLEGILTIDPHTTPKDVVLQELSRHASTSNPAGPAFVAETYPPNPSALPSVPSKEAIDPHTAPKDVALQQLSRHASTSSPAGPAFVAETYQPNPSVLPSEPSKGEHGNTMSFAIARTSNTEDNNQEPMGNSDDNCSTGDKLMAHFLEGLSQSDTFSITSQLRSNDLMPSEEQDITNTAKDGDLMLYEQQQGADTTKDDDLIPYEQQAAADTTKDDDLIPYEQQIVEDTVTHTHIVTERYAGGPIVMKAKVHIAAGTIVAPFCGTVVCRDDLHTLREDNPTLNWMYFHINDFFVVDATVSGATARFATHSCDPNCKMVIGTNQSNEIVPQLVACRDIIPGEEITRDFAFHSDPKLLRVNHSDKKVLTPCNCESSKCRQYIDSEALFDLSTKLGQELLLLTNVVKLNKERMDTEDFKSLRMDESLHHARLMHHSLSRACQWCRITDRQNKKQILRCMNCNLYLCMECFYKDFHFNLDQNKITATNEAGMKYCMKYAEQRDAFIMAKLNTKLEVASERDKVCPQRFDSENHGKIINMYGKCLLCNGVDNVSRCIDCFADVCEECWYNWHPCQDPICKVHAIRGGNSSNPSRKNKNKMKEKTTLKSRRPKAKYSRKECV